MPAPLSVIIPTLNAARTIGPTLECLYDGMGNSLVCEVIFTDGGSDDAIKEIADTAGARLITGPQGRGKQLHAGAKAAKGKWLLFIHADTVLSPNWVAEMKRHITAHSKAGYCKLAFDRDGFAPRFIAYGANLRSRVFGLPYGDQALLISKVLYEKTGGYPDIPLMEDVALARKLHSRLMALPITATTRSDRYVKAGWVRRTAQNLGTLMLYFIGVSPDRLVKRYRR